MAPARVGREAAVGNVGDPNYTMVAKIAKAYLGAVDPYQGAHDRLRGLASEYLAHR